MAHAKDVVRVRRMTTIYLNGQPISELRDLRFERVEPEAPALRPDPWTVAATGHIEDSEAFWSGLRRLFPARPQGEAGTRRPTRARRRRQRAAVGHPPRASP